MQERVNTHFLFSCCSATSVKSLRAAEFSGNATFTCGGNNLTATPIKWIGFQNPPKRNTHHACELTCWITDARSPPAWPPIDSRGRVEEEPPSAGSQRCWSVATKSYQAVTTIHTVLYAQLRRTRFTYQRSRTVPASRAAERAEGETKQIWQVSSTFLLSVAGRRRHRPLL